MSSISSRLCKFVCQLSTNLPTSHSIICHFSMVKGSWLAPRSLQCQLRACYMKCCCSQQVTHQRHLISQLWVSKRCAWLCAMVGHFIEARQCNLLLDGRAFWSNLQGQRIFLLPAYTVDTGLPHAIHSPRRVHVCCRSHEWSKTQRASPESPVSPDCRLGDGKQSQQVGTRQSRDKRSSVWKTTWQRRGRRKKCSCNPSRQNAP